MIFGVGVLRVGMMVCSLGVVIVVQVKRGLSDIRLLNVIICKLKRREKHFPVLILKCKGSDELLNNFNHNFKLPISLRVFGGRYKEVYSQNLLQVRPEMRGKLGVAVGDNVIREAVVLKDIPKE